MSNIATIEGRFISSKTLQELLGVSRQRISDLARQQDWPTPHPGLYEAEAVERYLYARWRAELATQFGQRAGTGGGPIAHDDSNDRAGGCPVCGAFAMWDPDWRPDQPGQRPWRCIQGHSGMGY